LLNPLVMLGVYFAVFRVFLRIEPPTGEPSGLRIYALFLLTGLLPWQFVAASITGSLNVLLANAGLIKKVAFPREVLPASVVTASTVTFLIEIAVLMVAFLVVGSFVVPWLPVVLLVVVVQIVFLLGLANALSALNVYFRDVEHLTGIFLQVWFYSSPIVYPRSLVPERANLFGVGVPVGTIYDLNPLVAFLDAYRALLYHLRFPSLRATLTMLAWSTVTLVVGRVIFRQLDRRLAEEL
jgi:ABC-2 type transport system permease protein